MPEYICFVIYFANTYGLIQPLRPRSEVICLQVTSHYTCLDFLFIKQRSWGLYSFLLKYLMKAIWEACSGTEAMYPISMLGTGESTGQLRLHGIHNSVTLDTRKLISLVTVLYIPPVFLSCRAERRGRKKSNQPNKNAPSYHPSTLIKRNKQGK